MTGMKKVVYSLSVAVVAAALTLGGAGCANTCNACDQKPCACAKKECCPAAKKCDKKKACPEAKKCDEKKACSPCDKKSTCKTK